MKDLDFDELDKAVSSVITKTPVSDDSGDLNQSPNLSSNDAKQPSNADVDNNTDTTNSSTSELRKSGQFMDVMHSSSDMRRRSSLTMPERVTNEATPNDTVSPTVDVDNPITQPDNSQSVTDNPASTDNKEGESISNSDQDQDEGADINRISDEITNGLSQIGIESLDSPFISGTKVEKRPLGAFSKDSTNQPDVKLNQEPTVAPNESNSSENTITPLPDELKNDLLKIESDNLVETKDDLPTTIGAVKPTSDEVKIEAPTSIVQQYKEQPSSGDQNTGAIYDTDSYHKGLISPIKKKSGWMWVVWIALLLVVGAGVSTALYFFVFRP